MAVINQSNVRLPLRISVRPSVCMQTQMEIYMCLCDTFFKRIKCSFWPIRGLVLVNSQVDLMALVQSHCFLWPPIKHSAL